MLDDILLCQPSYTMFQYSTILPMNTGRAYYFVHTCTILTCVYNCASRGSLPLPCGIQHTRYTTAHAGITHAFCWPAPAAAYVTYLPARLPAQLVAKLCQY